MPDTSHHPRRPTQIAAARWATLSLIIFVTGIVLSPLLPFQIDREWTALVKDWMFIPVVLYLAIQFDETATRNTSDIRGFMADNGLAALGVLIGLGAYLTEFLRSDYRLTYELNNLLLQATVAGAFDLIYGIIIFQRIASSQREREEEPSERR
jgi:hypothetical protein